MLAESGVHGVTEAGDARAPEGARNASRRAAQASDRRATVQLRLWPPATGGKQCSLATVSICPSVSCQIAC